MPSRRTCLAVLTSGLVGVAGCLVMDGDSDASHPAGGTTSPGTATEEPTDGIVVEDVVVRKAVTYESMMGSGGVLDGDDQQYVVAAVRSIADPGGRQFTLALDDESFDPGLPDTVGAMNRSVAGRGGDGAVWKSGAHNGGSRYYLAFTVPSPIEVDEARIRVSGGANRDWRLPDEARTRLGAPEPRFELDSLEVPEEISRGDPLPVAITVTNGSDDDGRFLAAAYWPTKVVDDDESHVLERHVPADETATVATELRTDYTAREDGPVTLSIDGHVEAEDEVRVRDNSTPS